MKSEKSKLPETSIVIGFRNRDLQRVQHCFDSIAQQSFINFEVIFIDYGSDEEISSQVKDLISNYSFAKYFYSDTRGWFWNRAHALNTGINLSSGHTIILADVDLIFPHDYLEQISNLSFNNTYYTFSCYYMSEWSEYSNITAKDLLASSVNYVGLCAISKDVLVKNNCFDEYYMNWGGEDDDLYKRVENSGCKRVHVGINKFPILHQWHNNHAPSYPTTWYLNMVDYLYSKPSNKSTNYDYGLLVETKNRSVLNRINNLDCFKKLELFPNPLFQFNLFLNDFFKMNSGEFGQFHFPILHPAIKGRKQKLIEKFNVLLIKMHFPYTLQKESTSIPIHTRETWNEFIMYFIGKNRALLNDYYIIDTEKKLILLFQKK